ncbi:MAG: hypothetical protein Kow0010_16050 [Dehalococcoidia bacterium]
MGHALAGAPGRPALGSPLDEVTIEARRYVVRGRVQGVGFRMFVYRRANQAGLKGWVRNLPDGRSVEAFVQGEPGELDDFAERVLRHGPGGAILTEFEQHGADVDATLDGFFVTS